MTVCGFCKGGPVGNAATWLDGKPRPPAPCPRCGETYGPVQADSESPTATSSGGAGGEADSPGSVGCMSTEEKKLNG